MKLAEQLETIIVNRLAQDNLMLPLLAPIAGKVNELVRRSDASIKELTDVIQNDPLLTALTVRSASSLGTTTLEQTVNKLGAQRVRGILAEACGRKVMESRDNKTMETTRLIWEHSRAVGILAQRIGVLAGVPDPDVCFVAGLLHDIGKPVLASILLEAEAQIVQRNPKLWIDGEVWVTIVDNLHRRIAIELAQKWQFPEVIQAVMAPFTDYDVGNRLSIWNAVHFSNAVVKQLGIYPGKVIAEDNDALVMVGRSLLGVDDEGLGRVTGDLKAKSQFG
jgi:HD-like signal output (HDOD) protein